MIQGTKYVYESFFRPYIAKHETDIDRNLLELRTRAGDMAFLYWQQAASYIQTRAFDIFQFIAAQSTPKQPAKVQFLGCIMQRVEYIVFNLAVCGCFAMAIIML